MKFSWIRECAREYPVRTLCRVLNVKRVSYYAWCKRSVSKRAQSNQQLVPQIRSTFVMSRETYGSPRVHDQLKRNGVVCSENRVARLMRQEGLISVRRRKFRPQTTNSNHDQPIAPNLLDQQFNATAPNQRWVGDITYVKTDQGWLYLAVIIDLFSRRVVGWATSSSINAQLVCRAFDMAFFRRRRPKDLVYHSDRGVQYASFEFRRLLKAYGITPSMSRRGNCYDNAVAESFFNTLKVELIHRYRFFTREVARTIIGDFIEEFYNVNRAHSSLDYSSPADYEYAHNYHPNRCVY